MDAQPKREGLCVEAKDRLILALWPQVHVLQRANDRLEKRIAELESQPRRPGKTPRNSSLPPSKVYKPTITVAEPRKQSDGDAGQAQGVSSDGKEGDGTKPSRAVRLNSVGRAGGGRALHPTPDPQVQARLKRCPHCPHPLSEADHRLHGRDDKIDLPPVRPAVTRVSRFESWCPSCAQVSLAPVPVGLEPGTPLGSGVAALAAHLRLSQAIGFERLSRLMAEVFGLEISEGGLCNLPAGVRERLSPRVEETLSRLQRSELVCSF